MNRSNAVKKEELELESGGLSMSNGSGDAGLKETLAGKLQATRRQYVIYALVFFTWGCISNSIGKMLSIAEFGHWWQVFTCYVVYLVPVSLLLRDKSTFEQYVYGVFALAPLELLGYSLGTSIAHPDNLFDLVLGPRNFTLAMCVFFGIIPPVGNFLVRSIEGALFREADREAA